MCQTLLQILALESKSLAERKRLTKPKIISELESMSRGDKC